MPSRDLDLPEHRNRYESQYNVCDYSNCRNSVEESDEVDAFLISVQNIPGGRYRDALENYTEDRCYPYRSDDRGGNVHAHSKLFVGDDTKVRRDDGKLSECNRAAIEYIADKKILEDH